MTKTGQESVLQDLTNKVRKVKSYNTDSVETSPLPTETITATETLMDGFLGLVPFADISVIPDNAEWNRVGNDLESGTEAIEIYELTWLDKTYAGFTIFNKWLFFVDPKTNLPQRTESYRKLDENTGYDLLSAMEVKYLSDSEMKAIIKETSF
jgi:hypothetical protein